MSYANPDALVSTAWLRARLGQPGLVVADITKYLPNEPKDGKAEFARAHIPGAVYFDIDDIADPDTDLPHMVPSAARFAEKVGALGIGNDSMVVCYDQKGLASAARGWWMLRLFGHGKVAVLDGGLPKWLAEGGPTEAGPAAPKPARFAASFNPAMLRRIEDVKANLASGRELVLDARATGRFAGTAPEPRPGVRAGHIPGSRSLPFTDLLNPDLTFKPADAIRARLQQAGLGSGRPIVTSCGSGVTACILTLAMHLVGEPVGAVYDGSWSEWGARQDVPVETGA
ncbi:MAG: 3-mercaptopyruvate sulfurtransferase [Alphaproteobacteria bacterium]|nr:3-mercaptopyruvate sulfurtransferase [Alphaproteobacteria bacterium]